MLLHILLVLLVHFVTKPASSAHCTTTTTFKTFQKCMTFPTQQASMAWTYHTHNATMDLVFFGNFISPSGWVAWGINPTSAEMTGTRTLIAFPDPNSGQMVLLPYILDPSVKLQKSPLLSQPLDIHLVSSSVVVYGGKMATIHNGATVQIYATLKLAGNKTRIHIVWNRGLYVQGYSPTIHPTTINDLSSVATIDVQSGISNSGNSYLKTLKIVHDILNAISWGFLLPVGAVLARYLRHMRTLGPIWFYAHAGETRDSSVLPRIIANSSSAVQAKDYDKLQEILEAMGEEWSYSMLAYCLGLSTLVGICIALEVNGWVVFCRNAQEEKMIREGVLRCDQSQKPGSSGTYSHHSRS
ncbi:unnamed protein product [Rhodiola kirilowii]